MLRFKPLLHAARAVRQPGLVHHPPPLTLQPLSIPQLRSNAQPSHLPNPGTWKQCRLPSSISLPQYVPSIDPYTYTSGKWLRNHEAQVAARNPRFNFDELCRLALARRPSASRVLQCDKRDGYYNRAFLLHLDDGSKLVARIPFLAAGPPRLTTNSEVATMTYIRRMTSIPMPEILDWSDDPANAAGTEYIIMEHAQGRKLEERWDSMNWSQHLDCVQSLGSILKEFAGMRFPAYGSIYFDSAPVDDASRVTLGDGFIMGPSLARKYWPECWPGQNFYYHNSKSNRGPWSTFEEFVSGLVAAGVCRFPLADPPVVLEQYGTVRENLELINSLKGVVAKLSIAPEVRSVCWPRLAHRSLHKRNIFISDDSPSKITAVLGWQSASIDPIFLFAQNTPDLCAAPRARGYSVGNGADVSLKTLAKLSEVERDDMLCHLAFQMVLAESFPHASSAHRLHQDVLDAFNNCFESWEVGAAAVRENIRFLSQVRPELQLPGDSNSYGLYGAELARHTKLFEDFLAIKEWRGLNQAFFEANNEGRVETDGWEEFLDIYEFRYDSWMTAATVLCPDDPDDVKLSPEVARAMWFWDTPEVLRKVWRQ